MVVLRHSSAYAADRAARQGPRTDSRSMRGPCAVESVGVLPAGELQHPEQNSIDADDDAEGEDPPAGCDAEEAQRCPQGGPERCPAVRGEAPLHARLVLQDRKSTRLNSSHVAISYAVFCLKKKTYTCN